MVRRMPITCQKNGKVAGFESFDVIPENGKNGLAAVDPKRTARQEIKLDIGNNKRVAAAE